MFILKVKNLEASYGKLKVLHKVNLKVEKSSVVLLVGKNGSGKSTVLKCIASLIKKDAGAIDFFGQSMAFVPQGRKVFSSMTVHENLEIGAYKICNPDFEKVYKLFPILKRKKNQRANLLSGGQQQMLSIGRGLMMNPDLLILDEPSLGLDPKAQKIIFKKICEINKTGTTILLVEQNIKQALKIAHKTYALENGRNIKYHT